MVKAQKLPPLPAGAPGKNKYKYQEQFGVVVVCRDEAEHKQAFERLTALGYKVKAVRV